MTDEYHKHEALDRCNMLAQMVETWLIDHPYVEQHSAVSALAHEALVALNDAYQMISILALPTKDDHETD